MNADKVRLQRAAIKIGRCLFYRDHKRVMPNENCKDIRLCEREEDVPELYTLSWEMSKVNANDLIPPKPGALVVVISQGGNSRRQSGVRVGGCPSIRDGS